MSGLSLVEAVGLLFVVVCEPLRWPGKSLFVLVLPIKMGSGVSGHSFIQELRSTYYIPDTLLGFWGHRGEEKQAWAHGVLDNNKGLLLLSWGS